MDYKFKKSVCERYDIKFNNGWGWAIITIDENGGVFNCQSDYGNYAYAWPNHGRESFKHFILEITRDYDYLLKKVSARNYFNFDKSKRNWQKEIIRARRENECTKEQARDAWEFIEELDGYCDNVEIVQKELCENRDIETIAGGEPWYVFEVEMEYSPGAMAFAKEIMPRFAEILKQEIESSRKVV